MFQTKDVMATVLNWDIAKIVRGTLKFFDLPSNSPHLEEGGQHPYLCQKVMMGHAPAHRTPTICSPSH